MKLTKKQENDYKRLRDDVILHREIHYPIDLNYEYNIDEYISILETEENYLKKVKQKYIEMYPNEELKIKFGKTLESCYYDEEVYNHFIIISRPESFEEYYERVEKNKKAEKENELYHLKMNLKRLGKKDRSKLLEEFNNE